MKNRTIRLLTLLTLAALLLLPLLTACGNRESEPAAQASGSQTGAEAGSVSVAGTADKTDPADTPNDESTASGSTLVVVFSATGTTLGVAEKIAAIENADLYEIKAAQEYTSDDLNWHDSGSRTSIEQNDKNARPEIGSEPLSLEGYEKIYIGFPIWWGEEPRIMDTFAETYSFDGITMIPFCTSGSSGIGRSGQNLAELSGSGNWLEGKRFGGGVSESDLTEWIGSLNG